VIGNAKYLEARDLKNPTNDADDIASKLGTRGFTVTRKSTRPTRRWIEPSATSSGTNLQGKDVGLFFFAGHRVQVEGDNYFAATDTESADEVDAKHSALCLNRVIETLEKSGHLSYVPEVLTVS